MIELQLGVWEGIDYKCEVSRRDFFSSITTKLLVMVHDSWWEKSAATMRQGELYVWGCSNWSLENKENKRDI